MIGKTNILVRGTHYVTGPLTVDDEGRTYLPADYDLDYFSQVTVPQGANNYLKKACEDTLTQVTDHELGDVTVIPSNMFFARNALTYVDLPATVTRLGSNVFAESGNLATLRMDCPNLSVMGTYCFDNTGLVNAYVNVPLVTLGSYSFSNNRNLVNINLVAVKTIDSYVFYNDVALTEVVIPSNCTSVSTGAFALGSTVTTNANLDLFFARHAIYVAATNTAAQTMTNIGQNVVNNRNASSVRFFVPFDSIRAYRVSVNKRNSALLNRVYTYLECEANTALPATTTQNYVNVSGTYSIDWYSDKALTQAVTQAATAGRYYGVITVVEEV